MATCNLVRSLSFPNWISWCERSNSGGGCVTVLLGSSVCARLVGTRRANAKRTKSRRRRILAEAILMVAGMICFSPQVLRLTEGRVALEARIRAQLFFNAQQLVVLGN